MSRLSSLHEESLDRQAARWAARLEGEPLSAADRQAFELWLGQDPRHRVRLSEYCQLSSDLEKHLPGLLAEGAVLVPATQPRAPRWGRLGAWSLAAAAAVVLLFTLARPHPTSGPFATAAAQRRTILLDDGTKIDLNAQTNLVVDLSGSERHVRLAEGEAFFSVAKDKSRPFIVETPLGSVRVTGTAFNVRADLTGELEVAVAEGTVLVRPSQTHDPESSAPFALKPGDDLLVAHGDDQLHVLSPDSLEDVLAWRQGQAVFTGVPLRAALARFARYHGKGIVASKAASELRLGGRYSLDDLDGFCTSLEAVLPVRVSRDLSGTIRVTLRTEN